MNKILLLIALVGGMSWGQFSYSGCEDIQQNDFKLTSLLSKGATGTVDNTLKEPVQMAFEKKTTSDGTVYSMIYIVERHGKIKLLHGVLKTVKVIGELTGINTGGDGGLTGIALDNDFSNNRVLYLYYAIPGASNVPKSRKMRVSRFTLNNDGTLNNSSEKVLIEIEGNPKDDWHHGGPMAMDKKGDLWITVGNDSPDHNSGSSGSHISTTSKLYSDEWGASNTANMRGSILRIHPDENAPKGYTIPEGNFGAYWAQKFASEGKGSLAQEYANPTKVLPEIYTKGHRSNFSVTVDPKGKFMMWGEVNGTTDEINVVTHPVFAGYPYFHGAGTQRTSGHSQDPLSPTNTSSFNTGVQQLPPLHEANFAFSGVAIAGPIYEYTNVKSSTKFPPHYDGKFFVGDWRTSWMKVLDLEENGAMASNHAIFGNMQFHKPIDIEFGAEGSLYVLNYGAGSFKVGNNTGLVRVDYTGTCHPTIEEPQDSSASILAQNTIPVQLQGHVLQVVPENTHDLVLYDVRGTAIWTVKNSNRKYYDLKTLVRSKGQMGMIFIQVRMGNMSQIFKVPLI